MEARLTSLRNFFDNNSSQFYIPIFQREYNWKKENVEQLLIDLENVLNKKYQSHFFGNVIYKTYAKSGKIISKKIIDGQQRITTFFLIFNALKNLFISINNEYSNQINELFLENKYTDDKFKLKLKPDIDNTDVYKRISVNDLNNIDHKYNKNNLLLNYKIIQNTVKNWIDNYSIDDFFDLFNKVKIVEIIIEEKDDMNSQKIFESINSTGLTLTNFDLIRNYVLMDISDEDQERIYSNNWKKFENEVFKLNKKNIDKLVRILIQFLKKDYVEMKNIYTSFKEIFHLHDNEPIKIISELEYALELYKELFYSDISDKVDYDSFLSLDPKNNELFSTVFMVILEKYKKNLIDFKEYKNCKKILSEYILRRKMADLDTSPITRFFNETILRKINKLNVGLESTLKKILFEENRESQMYAPNNDQIKELLKNYNFYSLNICKTFFWYLENWKNPIHIMYDSLTIEHIAPRSPNKGQWLNMLGVEDIDDYNNKINLLGNLTIIPSKANVELSNNNWNDKKNILEKYRHIKLNQWFLEQDIWNYDNIIKRQNELVETFFEIFK